MPNNISNKLQFIAYDNGKTFSEIKEFLKSDKNEIDFEKLIPLNSDWSRDKAVEMWGTKWNSYSVKIVENDYTLTYLFETAWSYPKPIIDFILKEFKDKCSMNFTSACEGGWFAVTINQEEDEEIIFNEWNSNLGNDVDFKVRNAIKQALSI